MPETYLRYNGIVLRNCLTLDLLETPIHDETGMVHIYTKTNLKVRGYFTQEDHDSLGIFPNFGPPVSTNDFQKGSSNQFAMLRSFLEEPRRALLYSTAAYHPNADVHKNYILFYVIPANAELADNQFVTNWPPDVQGTTRVQDVEKGDMCALTDMHGGPFPKNVDIVHIANNTVWRVEMEFEFCLTPQCIKQTNGSAIDRSQQAYQESLSATQPINQQVQFGQPPTYDSYHRRLGIVSNRWNCVDSINENSYTIRTYNGAVTLSNPHWNPHDYRLVTLPPLTPGMRRKSIEYRAAENGLKLQYTIVDEEVTITPPLGCSDIRITHNEAAIQLGARVEFNLRISLKAERNGSLYTLHRIAVAIIESRLGLRPGAPPTASTQVQRYDITTEQGSDQNFTLVATISGWKVPFDNETDIPDHLNRIGARAFKRQRSVPASILQDYNNNRAKGNRETLGVNDEQPHFEGSIPAMSALHCAIQERCTETFDVESNMDSYLNRDARLQRIAKIDSEITPYDYDQIYQYAPTLLAEEYDELSDAPDYKTLSLDHYEKFYNHYRINNHYQTSNSKIQLPVANTLQGGTYPKPFNSVFVQLAPAQRSRVIRVEAERIGGLPKLPTAPESFTENSDTNLSASDQVTNRLLSSRVIYQEPAPTADGTNLVYTAHLELEYGLDRPPEKHWFGTPEYLKAAAAPATDPARSPYSATIAEIFSGAWTINT